MWAAVFVPVPPRPFLAQVHSIFMCTAARDSLGWVSFLKVVLEKWYGRKIYDNVVEGACLY